MNELTADDVQVSRYEFVEGKAPIDLYPTVMAVTRPFRRTCRQFSDGSYAAGGKWGYVVHPRFSVSPEHFIRAFQILQQDLERVFQYVEPADANLPTFSYRTHELLLRACVEVESNCKAILSENGYRRAGDWNMDDYRKIEGSHRLSSYRVKLPFWHGGAAIRQPFEAWAAGGRLGWYSAYNSTKHGRHLAFPEASFENLLDAISGVVVLLSAQFWTHDYGPGSWLRTAGGPNDGYETAIGGLFRVQFPADWPAEDRYEFNWQELKEEPDPFVAFRYP